MDERRIVYVSYIASDLAAVWEALTNPDITELYWSGTRVQSDWKIGSKVLYMRAGTVTDEHILLTVEPPHSLRHSFHPVFTEEFRREEPSRVTFTLEQNGDVVRLTLIHDKFAPGSRIFAVCCEGWPAILSSLKTLLETGKPLPASSFPPVSEQPIRTRKPPRTRPEADTSPLPS
ncbi:MAG TPA: SRPBCC domain-containing protein, partial [Burkholderiales bacterium]|nr:SRPBCC domain-containing protein [Burkholderiales bacterium]